MADRCENCGTTVDDTFCAHCGQAVASIDLPVKDFARDMASEAFGLDSRVRRTMGPLVFEPGRVAAEYVAGHRARFVPPFRLYLLTSLVMFLVLSFGQLTVGPDGARSDRGFIRIGTSSEATADSAATDPAEDTVEDASDFGARIEAGVERLLEDPDRFRDQFIGNMSRAMILLLPLFALLLKLAWWKRLYVHHFVFSMYFHAFSFLVIAVAGLPNVFGLTTLGMWADLLFLWIPVHLVFALKHFYGAGWFGAIGKAVLVYLGYALLGGSVVSAALVLSLLTF